MVQWLIDWWEETPDVAAAVAGNTLLDSLDAVEEKGFLEDEI